MHLGKVLALAISLFGASSAPASAYVDPGAGSMILQAVIGAAAAGVTVISIYWQKIKAFISKKFVRTSKKHVENEQSK